MYDKAPLKIDARGHIFEIFAGNRRWIILDDIIEFTHFCYGARKDDLVDAVNIAIKVLCDFCGYKISADSNVAARYGSSIFFIKNAKVIGAVFIGFGLCRNMDCRRKQKIQYDYIFHKKRIFNEFENMQNKWVKRKL